MTPGKHVLVVDDEPGFCDTVKDILEDEGYAVAVATDGQAALELLRANPAATALVILDLVMPVADGLEVYRAMQADPELRAIPVVFATSNPARAPDGVPVLAKPLSLDRLIDAVRRHAR